MNNVPIKSLRRWMQIGHERKKGGGRKVRDPKMERRLYEWYKNCLKEGFTVTPRMIKLKALSYTRYTDFNASKGWLAKIQNKYSLELYNIKKCKKEKFLNELDDKIGLAQNNNDNQRQAFKKQFKKVEFTTDTSTTNNLKENKNSNISNTASNIAGIANTFEVEEKEKVKSDKNPLVFIVSKTCTVIKDKEHDFLNNFKSKIVSENKPIELVNSSNTNVAILSNDNNSNLNSIVKNNGHNSSSISACTNSNNYDDNIINIKNKISNKKLFRKEINYNLIRNHINNQIDRINSTAIIDHRESNDE
jgi:hypothetical protein